MKNSLQKYPNNPPPPPPPPPPTAGNAESAVHPSGTPQDNTNKQIDATTTGTTTVPEDLPTVIQDLMEHGVVTMDVEEIGVASAAARTTTTNPPQRIVCRMEKL